jgi:hypothetical protein
LVTRESTKTTSFGVEGAVAASSASAPGFCTASFSAGVALADCAVCAAATTAVLLSLGAAGVAADVSLTGSGLAGARLSGGVELACDASPRTTAVALVPRSRPSAPSNSMRGSSAIMRVRRRGVPFSVLRAGFLWVLDFLDMAL